MQKEANEEIKIINQLEKKLAEQDERIYHLEKTTYLLWQEVRATKNTNTLRFGFLSGIVLALMVWIIILTLKSIEYFRVF